jgi:hypothetical protein
MTLLQDAINRYTNGVIQDLEYLQIISHYFNLHTRHNYTFLDY